MGARLMFTDVSRALAQVGDPRFRRVLFMGLGLTVGILFLFYIATVWIVGWMFPETVSLPFVGEVTFLHTLAQGGSLILVILLSSFLMIPVASAFTGLFLDQVADAVEDKHFPHLPPARPMPIMTAITDSAQFLGVMILANIVALIFYLLFLVIMPPLAPLTFYALNGFLLGREYFQLVAMRRVGLDEAKALRRRFRRPIWMLGAVMAVPLTVPILNLVVPIIGAASFTHLYHRLMRS